MVCATGSGIEDRARASCSAASRLSASNSFLAISRVAKSSDIGSADASTAVALVIVAEEVPKVVTGVTGEIEGGMGIGTSCEGCGVVVAGGGTRVVWLAVT